MANQVKPVPAGYHTLTAYISVQGASQAIAFYKKALGAEEVYRLDMPDGRVGHCELQIGDSRIMLADENDMPDAVSKSPQALGGTTVGFNLYIPDVDIRFQKAVDAGAKIRRPLQDQFYGDRSGTVEDPFGHIWTLATHVEDVSPEEMKRRMESMPQPA